MSYSVLSNDRPGSIRPAATARQADAATAAATTNAKRPLYLLVGARRVSPCDHDCFQRFQAWVAQTLTRGTVERYDQGGADILHFDRAAGERFPHLLNPCECGTYLPLAGIEPGPMLSSALGLREELTDVAHRREELPADFHPLLDALMEMTAASVHTHTPLEIR